MLINPTERDLIQVLYEALGTPLGLLLRTDPDLRDNMRIRLYAARRAAMDPALSCLQLRLSPNREEIFLVKGQERTPPDES